MGRQHVDHADIVRFAEERVNLRREDATELRAQTNRLRERLEAYLAEHPDFGLRKMLLSGSLAKGTALRSLNDIDIACYISGADAPTGIATLLNYLAERLRKAFPNFNPDQVQPQTSTLTVSFRGSGLDVDVVPILYEGAPDWYGKLVSQDDGSLLSTSVPRHLEFIRKRKAAQEKDFAQVARLVCAARSPLPRRRRQAACAAVPQRRPHRGDTRHAGYRARLLGRLAHAHRRSRMGQ